MSIATYDTLRRVEKSRLDREAAILTKLRGSLEKLEQLKQELQEAMVREGEHSDPADQILSRWINQEFMKSTRIEVAKLDAQIAQLRTKLAEQEERVRKSYCGMRRFEILIEQEEEREQKARMRKEIAALEDGLQAKIARARSAVA